MITEIFDISFDGLGVGKYEDKIVFIPNTIIGDVVDFEVVKDKKNFSFGKVLSFAEKSKHRKDAECPFFSRCGGCDFLNLEESYEQELKETMVKNRLNRSFEMEKAEFIASNKPYNFHNYRNKVVFQCKVVDGKLVFGFFEKASNDLINITSCVLFDKKFIEIATKLVDALNNVLKAEELLLVKHIVLKKNSNDEVLLGIVIKEYSKDLEKKLKRIDGLDVSTFVLNINGYKNSVNFGEKSIILKGEGFIKESLFNYVFDISLVSFFQINREQTIHLYELIHDFLDGEGVDCVIDGYCGVGTIAFSISKFFKKVIGVESLKRAYKDALASLENSDIDNVEFIHGKFEDKIGDIIEENKNSAIILDPPRKGCESEVLASIVENNIDKVVYVSCDLSGFIKDMRQLEEHYYISKYSVINMFPRTKDIESVFLLRRK